MTGSAVPVGETLQGLDLHFDCFAGIAGDMTLGALLHLGVPEAVVMESLLRLPFGGYRLAIGEAVRSGLAGIDVKVIVEGGGHHAHRAWRAIRELLESSLAGDVLRRSLAIFERVAAAEATIHGVGVDEVSFHEVGAVDSIVDAVGVAACLAWLAPRRVTARPVPLGHGEVRCQHGHLPVPAPAALEILRAAGAPVEDGGVASELTTPTGAAILAATVDHFGALPPMVPRAVGYGAGDADPKGRPNMLRVILGSPVTDSDDGDGHALVVEANIDDMSPELCEPLLEALFAAGARDAWLVPIIMKKGRPALQLGAICGKSAQAAVTDTILTHSTTIGLRMHPVARRVLARRVVTVETPYGVLPVKQALDGDRVLNAAPEYEPCRAAARAHDVPLKEVYAAVMASYRRLG